jgi:putative transposase
MRCLNQALLPKLDLLGRWPDLDLNWPCFGRPETLLVDHGPEFHSQSLKDACRVFGIDLQFAPAKAPWFKGRVERFFGSLNTGLLHKLPGTTFSNPQKRGTYESDRYAVLSLSDLERLLCQWLLADYAQRFHRGLNDRPGRFWAAAVDRDPVDLPALAAPDIRAMLGLVEERSLHHYGVEYLGLRYNNDAVQSVRRRHGDCRVRIKIDPSDLGSIWLVSPDTGEPVQIPSVRPDYAAGLPLAQHRVVRQRAGELANDRGSIEALCRAREALRQDVLRMIGDRRIKKRNRLARLAGADTLLALTDRAHASPQPSEEEKSPPVPRAPARRRRPATTETTATAKAIPDRGDVPEFSTEQRPADDDPDDIEDLPVETLHPNAGRRGTS